MLFRFALALVLAARAIAQQPETEPAMAAFRKGVATFGHGVYPEAARLFEEAYRLDPSLTEARVYYGYSEMMQYIPGETLPENLRHADVALEILQEAAGWQPPNELALKLLASLYFNMERVDEAAEAHRRLLDVDPGLADSHYTLGVIAWKKTYEPRMKLREELGMKPTEGPIVNADRRILLAIINRPIAEEGLHHLEQAIELNPEYADAMAYMNLLYRELADLSETQAEYQERKQMADQWVQRTLDAKKAQAAQAP